MDVLAASVRIHSVTARRHPAVPTARKSRNYVTSLAGISGAYAPVMMQLVTGLALLQWVVLALAIYVLAVCLGNLLTMPRLGAYPAHHHYPRVSVLVPARNEEENLPRLIPSLLAQDYPDFEVVVLDDNSSDRTPEILAEWAGRDSRLRVRPGRPVPPGWLGKNWACQQLSESAKGEWMLFTDADTVHQPGALRAAVDLALHENLDFVSAIVNQETNTWSERLLVPFFSIYHVFCAVPLCLGRLLPRCRFSVANGQFMLFRRQAYEGVGGYAAIRGEVLDDQSLARQVTARGLRQRFCDASRFVSCRMYRNWAGVCQGFTKSVFAVFDCSTAPFLLTGIGLTLLFFEPPAVLVLAACHGPLSPLQVPLAVAAILTTLVYWIAAGRRFRIPTRFAFLYPATVGLALAIGIRSAVMLSSGRATWKGRVIAGPAGEATTPMARPVPGLRTVTYLYWYAGVGMTLLTNAYYRMRR